MRRAAVIALAALALAAPAGAQVPDIRNGVTIADVDVAGLTAEEATAAVEASFAQPLAFRFGAASWQVRPARLGAAADVTGAVAAALDAPAGTAVPLDVTIERTALVAHVDRMARRRSIRPVNARVYLKALRPRITAARRGYAIRRYPTRMAIRAALRAHLRGPVAPVYRVVRPQLTRADFRRVVVIRRGSKRLFLYRGARLWRSFGVATGQPSFPTPLGRFTIVTRQRNPWWIPPRSPWAAGASPIPPGPGNPLGTRWMGLSRSGVGIHGTPNAGSIGYAASHGCVRMRIAEAEWLFERVRVGTTVFIVRV